MDLYIKDPHIINSGIDALDKNVIATAGDLQWLTGGLNG
jgi:hypothetical protein